MSNSVNSPNMLLPVPVVGVDPGPDYATNVNSCLTIIDGHNHSPGYGVQINPAGININSDLPFNNNNAISLRSARFTPQSSPLSLSVDIGCLYESGVDLYYNDGNGAQIRITQGGGLAGSPGTIANLTSPASASYVAANETFVWQSNVNTPANLDAASIILRNLTANSKGLTLNPPNAMAANYSITLPALPLQQTILTIDASGNIQPAYAIDNVTLVNNSGTLQASAAGLSDNVTIHSVSNVLSIKNGYMIYEFKLNGSYGGLTVPATEIDGFSFLNYNAEIVNVWAYNVTAGPSGTTTMDIKVATTPGGSFASIFSTPPSFTSAASSNNYVDANGVVAPGVGVTAPVLVSPNLLAGSALRMDLTSVMTGGADCGIVIQFKQRN